jgi:hypothetical protein
MTYRYELPAVERILERIRALSVPDLLKFIVDACCSIVPSTEAANAQDIWAEWKERSLWEKQAVLFGLTLDMARIVSGCAKTLAEQARVEETL